MYSNEEKLKAAYALNLCTVSVSQIVDYADINIMEQEANTILNNLNLERMPNADALRDILTQILDTTAFCRLQEKDKEMIDREYQHQVKNAVWNSIPRLGMIFASGNSAAMALTLATQVGIGYMNYRRNKADYAHAAEQKKWELERGKLEQFYGLQKALFSTAWNLAKEYEFPDEYRLTDQQIQDYSKILMEPNAITRYSKLNAIEDKFQVYPQFWYQMGSTANSIYGSNASGLTKAIKELYKAHALECFEKYQELNRFALLREDTLTAAWALEYIDLLDLNHPQEKEKAVALAELAEKNAGSAMDVIELCAFAQLKIGNHEKAAKLFERITDPALTVRRITINANKVTPDEGIYQVDFFTDTKKLEKEKKLQQAMLGIKNKYGKNAVLKASSYEEGATMRQRNAQIGGHSAGGSAGGSDGKLQK